MIQRHLKRRLAFLCILAAAFVAVCFATYRSIDRSRMTIVGETDPQTGCRIEYTVSNHYIRRSFWEVINMRDPQSPETWVYEPKPPPVALQWFDLHILRRQPLNTAVATPALGSIMQYTLPHGNVRPFFPPSLDAEGYATFNRVPGFAVISAQDRTMLHGCLFDFCLMEIPNPGTNRLYRTYYLLATLKGGSQIFVFSADLDATVNQDTLRKELFAIRDSLRIVKVK